MKTFGKTLLVIGEVILFLALITIYVAFIPIWTLLGDPFCYPGWCWPGTWMTWHYYYW